MPIVSAAVTTAKITTATYRILATAVMGYYLVKGVVDYEKLRHRENKRDVKAAFTEATDRQWRPPRKR